MARAIPVRPPVTPRGHGDITFGVNRYALHSSLFVTFLIPTACYSGFDIDDPLRPPDGYAAIARERLAEGVQVQLSAPRDWYEANPGYYDAITVAALEANDPALDSGFVNVLGLIINIQPDGLAFKPPLYLQVTWPDSVSADEAERAILFSRSAPSDRWQPLRADAMNSGARVLGAWVDHFSQFALEIPPLSIDTVTLDTPAIAGEDIELTVSPPSALDRYTPACEQCISLTIEPPRLKLKGPEGVLRLTIGASSFRELWAQDIYVSRPSARQEYEEWRLTAERFSPTLKFSRNYGRIDDAAKCRAEYLQEDTRYPGSYWPLGLESMFSDGVLLGIKAGGWSPTKVSGGEAVAFLTSRSAIRHVIDGQTSEAGLKTLRDRKTGSAVYWQLNDKVELSSVADPVPGRRVFLTYWMFYAWDAKSPDLSDGEHAMDRESMTVELFCPGNPDSCEPVAVWYAGHLEKQRMYILDPAEGKFVAGRWHGDVLRVPWNLVDRTGASETSPVAYVAYGSHALYPRAAIYYVDVAPFGLPRPAEEGEVPRLRVGGIEPACGDDEVFVRMGLGGGTAYELRDMDMSDLTTSSSPEAALLFSGSFVDGLFNDNFPPFLRRFHSQSEWADSLLKKNDADGWCRDASCLDDYPLSCGDGVVAPGEECDAAEGNSPNSACTHQCRKAVCGDGLTWTGVEACDDGNSDEADGCTSECEIAAAPMADCGAVDPQSRWFQIDFAVGATVGDAAVTFSPTPGWQEAEWSLEVLDVHDNIEIVADQIGQVAQISGSSRLRLRFSTLGLTAVGTPFLCLIGRSISVGSAVDVEAVNPSTNCGGSVQIANDWQPHEGIVTMSDDCILADQPAQDIDIFASGGSGNFGAKSIRLVLSNAQP